MSDDDVPRDLYAATIGGKTFGLDELALVCTQGVVDTCAACFPNLDRPPDKPLVIRAAMPESSFPLLVLICCLAESYEFDELNEIMRRLISDLVAHRRPQLRPVG